MKRGVDRLRTTPFANAELKNRYETVILSADLPTGK